ncbi:MAG TPA: glycoside hydrolase family 76 protein [Solirubrobacteraceae bacterium]|nr:glycoside hydrolase family 76 protein [Solirubrobacteraceae bacterium]
MRLALVALLCCAGAWLGPAAGAGAAGRSAGAAGRRAGAGHSAYPAGATRPAFVPRRSEYAHARAAARRRARAAGASGGSATPPAPSTPSKPSGSPKPGTSTTPAKGKRAKPKKPKLPVLHGNPARALVAFEAMQKSFYIAGSGLYEGEPFSYLWPFSQALAATVSVAYIPHLGATLGRDVAKELDARLTGLNSYLDTDNSGAGEGVYTSTLAAFDGTVVPPTGPGGTKYYDDNDWVGIELARLYQLTRKTALLGSAEGIMAFEMAGWDEKPGLACEGGIPFSNALSNGERNTVTTAPAAELGALLYKLTGDEQYLQFAEKAYEWVRSCLQQPANLYADHIGDKGVVEPALWSYNQGSMIGAGTLLYQATGNSGYLWQARQTAAAALAYFNLERLVSENPFFVSVYLRNLMYLDSVTHDPPGPSLAQEYVNYAWQNERLSDYLFVTGTPPATGLLAQAAIVQVYALLSIPASDYF